MKPLLELEALERAILADPDADAPRRRMGEALVARGDPRGRFIDLQLAAAIKWRRGETPSPAMEAETRALIAEHGPRWAGAVAREVDAHELRRGFVEHVTLDARAFLIRAERLYALAPIRHLTLTGARPVLAMLMASPHLERIRSLSLAGSQIGDDGVAVVAGSQRLHGLRWLDLRKNGLTRAGLDALAASSELEALRFVWLTGNPSGDPTPVSPVNDGWSQWPDPDVPALGRELIAQHGPRSWLTLPPPAWPADRDYDPA